MERKYCYLCNIAYSHENYKIKRPHVIINDVAVCVNCLTKAIQIAVGEYEEKTNDLLDNKGE